MLKKKFWFFCFQCLSLTSKKQCGSFTCKFSSFGTGASILNKKTLGLLGIMLILLVSSCSNIEVKKPILNYSNSNEYDNIKRYWISEKEAYEIVKANISDYRGKGLYLLKGFSGIEGKVRIAPTDVQGQYLVQLYSESDKSTYISVAVLNTQDQVTIYSPNVSSVYEKAKASPYLQGLMSHIDNAGDYSNLKFDAYICENYQSKIISFINSLKLSDFTKYATFYSTNQYNVEKNWEIQLDKNILSYLNDNEK